MSKDNFLDNTINSISDVGTNISNKYDNHIKQKAIKIVDENISSINLKVEDIESDDYEAMISEAMSEIKKEYSSNVAKVALGALGLDLLFSV